jgi:hypothetical protein
MDLDFNESLEKSLEIGDQDLIFPITTPLIQNNDIPTKNTPTEHAVFFASRIKPKQRDADMNDVMERMMSYQRQAQHETAICQSSGLGRNKVSLDYTIEENSFLQQLFDKAVKANAEQVKEEIQENRRLAQLRKYWEKAKDRLDEAIKQLHISRQEAKPSVQPTHTES